jgi:hypothetical protein
VLVHTIAKIDKLMVRLCSGCWAAPARMWRSWTIHSVPRSTSSSTCHDIMPIVQVYRIRISKTDTVRTQVGAKK